MSMGRWSELSSCSVFHEERSVVSGEVKEMSGDVGCVCMLKGLRVGVRGSLSIMCVSS